MDYTTIIGVFIRPRSFEIATGVFDPQYSRGNSVMVRDVASDDLIATGSIDHGQFGDKYKLSAEITGYPRAHATPGVDAKYRKSSKNDPDLTHGGWGTPLYVAEATAAYLHSPDAYGDDMPFLSDTKGDRPGVSSLTGTRQPPAEEWWAAALASGLSDSEEGASEEEVKEDVYDDDFELDGDSFGSNVDGAIVRALSGGDVTVDSVDYRIIGTWTGTRTGADETVYKFDVLTYDSCVEKGLIVLNTDATTRKDKGFYAWGDEQLRDCVDVYADVLRIVNTGYLAQKSKGVEAMETLVQIARKHLTASEVSGMIERFNARVDAGGVRYEEAVVAVQNPGRSRIRRVRVGRRTLLIRTSPKRKVIPRVLAVGRPVFYGPVPNPMSAALKKNLHRLYDRRVEMGYGALANLP